MQEKEIERKEKKKRWRSKWRPIWLQFGARNGTRGLKLYLMYDGQVSGLKFYVTAFGLELVAVRRHASHGPPRPGPLTTLGVDKLGRELT